MMAAGPSWAIVAVAALYSLGAHGIMTLNDFKALEGDRATGVPRCPSPSAPSARRGSPAW
jgi:chlorophyll/bacteriochlorophyll a synthase